MIERIHLSVLRAIDQEGSVTAAANKLCLTQSALSHTIKKLENNAGTALWDKQGRGLKLTQAGEYLLSTANRLLPQLERADEVLSYFASGDKGSLRIGMECHPCYQWLLKVVSPFLAQWPTVDIDIKQRFQFGGMAALFNHDIDILVTPDPLIKEGIEFIPVFDYQQVLLMSNQHPLANKPVIEPADLSEQTLYTYPVTVERLDIYREFLTPANRSPKVHKVVETTEMMLQLVSANRGVATLPQWLADQYQQSLPITYKPLGSGGIHKQIHLGRRLSDQSIAYSQAFFNLAGQQGL